MKMALPRIQNLTVRALISRVVLGCLVAGSGLDAQTTRDTIQFEVASVKPSAGDGRAAVSVSPSGLYTAMNMPIRLLIRNAFGLQLEEQLVGGPEWVSSARFDISAKAEAARPSIEHRRLMLQALLRDRFK